MRQNIFTAIVFIGTAFTLSAKENANVFRKPAPQPNVVLSGCSPSKSRADLDINNVRTPIWINGDMWWDLTGNAIYEVPVGSGKNSLFAGGIWIGGKDAAGSQLKVAAQTYRQSGSDFWPGPIDMSSTSITPDQCLEYDKHFKITFAEVKSFHEQFQILGDPTYPIPDVIKDWPGNGDPNFHQDAKLAPFFDSNGDGQYDYLGGDYPKYNIDPTANIDPCDKDLLLGDQTIWWVFNDVGNIHGETGSVSPVGIEIQAQAFGFSTNDEVNNMTFYRYKIINRATTQLNETYFGSWVDPDLGNYLDDYVGCDVARGLGYCYNGDADDDGALGYGQNPPAVGLDFFEGPLADTGDVVDNDRDGVVDEVGEQIIMAKFVYYNNDATTTGNPNTAQDYYNYLDGVWKDNNPLVYGGDGHQTAGAPPCNFMFPGDSDPFGIGLGGTQQNPVAPPFPNWSETQPTATDPPNVPSDRRFLQSAGKFTLMPGAVNYITTGAVWARTSSGGPLASVKLLKIADVKAQNLFESCFRVVNGPDAPDLLIRELDREVIFSIKNPSNSNNANEAYREKDINIPSDTNAVFIFEGYKVYQVKDPSVTINDLHDADRARLVFQADIQNGLSQIVNKELDGDLNAYVPTEEVLGEDKGLRHAFRITTDAFASGATRMVNHKTYFFMAVAYGYDEVADILDPFEIPPGYFPGLYGLPYIQSRKGADGTAVKVYSAIPHIPSPEANGLELNTAFGDGPEITRITGMGNGHILGSDRRILDLKQDQVESILFNQSNPSNRLFNPTYVRGHGPVDIRIYDAVKVPPAEFELWLEDTVTTIGHWKLKNLVDGSIYTSEKTLEFPYDQLFPDYGFSISMNQVKGPGEYPVGGNGAIGGFVEYTNAGNNWLSGLPDIDNFPGFNWILSGKSRTADPVDYPAIDEPQFYEKILGGTWAPFRLCNRTAGSTTDYTAPAPGINGVNAIENDSLSYLGSIDVIITPDKNKWSRCVVFETGRDATQNEGGQTRGLLRRHASMNLDGSYSTTDSGMSYFPGYAINVETGERLNIAFGEDSYLSGYNGADMKWNPTGDLYEDSTVIAGGKHYIYVFGNKIPESPVSDDTSYYGPAYDGCNHIYYKLAGITTAQTGQNAARQKIRQAWKDCMWVNVPLLTPGQSLLDNEVKIKLRVAKPYRQYETNVSGSINNNYPFYKFSTYDLVAKVNQTEVAKDALSLVNIVPNPYYAYSNYEANQLDNRIKIVNLPNKCVVSIYTVNGTLIRRFKRDAGFNNTDGRDYPDVNLESSLDWDLKNELAIPIASGMYIIHVNADGIGERTLKWFGVMRPIDLDTF